MRRILLSTALILFAACPQEGEPKLPPQERFYFPSAITHLPDGSGEGVLLVASTNYDNRYTFGALTLVDLDRVGLPAFGAAAEPALIEDLHVGEGAQQRVLTDLFAGPMMGVYSTSPAAARVFLPTRETSSRVHAVDVDLAGTGPRLTCGAPAEDPANCLATGIPLNREADLIAKPNAPQPMGVAVDAAAGKVYLTHRRPALDPLGVDPRLGFPEHYLVTLDALDPKAETVEYVSVGRGGSAGVVLTPAFAFLVGTTYADRSWNYSLQAPLIRVLDRVDPKVYVAALESEFRVNDGRAVGLSSDGTHLYVIGRVPDSLMVLRLVNGGPELHVVRGLPLPDDPNQLAVIPRAGKGDLVAITCSESGVVVLYDADRGTLVAQVDAYDRASRPADEPARPYGIAAELRTGGGARLYVTNFSDGQVAVFDLPNLDQPEGLRRVAILGRHQRCLLAGGADDCQ